MSTGHTLAAEFLGRADVAVARLGRLAAVDPVPTRLTDPARLAAIEADRDRPPQELWQRMRGPLDDLRALLTDMSAQDWQRMVSHSTLGILDMPQIFERFLVGHLQGHADQLDGLLAADGS